MQHRPGGLVGTASSVRFRLRAEIPSLPVANSQQAVNQTVNGVRVRSKIVPPVHRGAAAAPNAHDPTIPQAPAPRVAAPRTPEPGRPSEPLQVVRIGPEPRLELAKGPRIVCASPKMIHPLSLLRLNGYPRTAKCIRHTARVAAEPRALRFSSGNLDNQAPYPADMVLQHLLHSRR